MKTRLTWIIICITTLFACKKAENRQCWKIAGTQLMSIVPLDEFNKISIGAKLQITLVQDTTNFLEIIGYKNLNNFITTKIEDQTLHLSNDNKCDFTRKYVFKSIAIRLHFKHLESIHFKGTEDLFTEGTITTPRLYLDIMDGSGTVNLHVNTQSFDAVQGHGFGNYNVSGWCENSSQTITSNGHCDASKLTVNNKLIGINRSQVDCKFNLENTAIVELQTTAGGSIFYTGTPQSIVKSELGKGKIISLP